ncbi:MAG: 6-bladed beta-propeller [Rhodothermaceae bacterium]
MRKFSGVTFLVLILLVNLSVCQEKFLIKQVAAIEDDGENFEYLLDDPADLAFDTKGNIYLLEENGRCVKIFDNNGRFIKKFGRQGKGPGEFSTPRGIDLDNGNNIYVSDIGNGRITKFDSDGNYLSSIKAPYIDLNFQINNKNRLIFRNPNLDGGRKLSKNNVPLFCEVNNDGKLSNFAGQGVYFSEPPFNKGGNRLNFCLDKKDNLIAAFLFQNKIKKYSPEGKFLMEIELSPSRKKLVDRKLNLFSTLNKGVAADNKNRIWVLTKKREERKNEKVSSYILWDKASGTTSKMYKGDMELTITDLFVLDCYSETGKHIKRFQLNHFCDGIRINDDRIYIWEKVREMKLYIYEICD